MSQVSRLPLADIASQVVIAVKETMLPGQGPTAEQLEDILQDCAQPVGSYPVLVSPTATGRLVDMLDWFRSHDRRGTAIFADAVVAAFARYRIDPSQLTEAEYEIFMTALQTRLEALRDAIGASEPGSQ